MSPELDHGAPCMATKVCRGVRGLDGWLSFDDGPLVCPEKDSSSRSVFKSVQEFSIDRFGKQNVRAKT